MITAIEVPLYIAEKELCDEKQELGGKRVQADMSWRICPTCRRFSRHGGFWLCENNETHAFL